MKNCRLFNKEVHQIIYKKYIKRLLDFVVSLCAIIVLSPILLVLAVVIKIILGSPIIFIQERPGKDEKIFKMYKFRTMKDTRDENGEYLPDEVRLTKFGKWLRSTSLDELLELFNILKGDMSIIGPRPLLVKYLPLYNKKQHRRHEVKPGLSGFAQIQGRNAVTWKEKFDMDVFYVEHISLKLDLMIFFKSLIVAIKREGIAGQTSGTTEEFKGEEEMHTQ